MIKKFKHSFAVIGLLLTSTYSGHAVAGPELDLKTCDENVLCFLLSTTAAPTLTVAVPVLLTSDQFDRSENGSNSDRTKALKAGYDFYEKNYQQIKEDTARGDGPFLHAFSEVMLPNVEHWRPFKAAMRQKYGDYFSPTKPSSSGFLPLWDLRNRIRKGN